MLKAVACLVLIVLSFAVVHAADRSPYGGCTRVTGKATGFFHVTKLDGRWWCIDPSGAAFFAIGTDHVNYNVHWCEALGYAPYAQNIRKKYNNDESAWAKSATDRLKQWNFNALGANNSPSTRGRGLAWMGFLGMGADYAGTDSIVERVHWTGFPNVFNPAFAEYCEKKAQAECAPAKDDPWLFGWFIDNELEWFGKSHAETGLVGDAIKRPAEHEGKKALVELLGKKYADIARFNRAWGTSFGSWEDALKATSWQEHANEQVVADKREFVRLCADRYFAITTAAIKKADPNHMVIGCRFAGSAPPVWDIAGKYCDIVTLNYYGQVDLETLRPINLVEDLTRWYEQAKRPLMLTEWSFPALDAGLPCKHGAGMRVLTQADKAKCFEVYQKTFFSLPFMVGSDYFMWVDEPALGIAKTFPEDSNYGLVDVNDDAWEVFTKAVARVNAKAYEIHSGRTAELSLSDVEVTSPDGKELKLKVENAGTVDARTSVAVRVDAESCEEPVSVPAGATRTVTIRTAMKPGAHYVQAEIDPEGTLDEVNRGDNKISQFVYVVGHAPGEARAALGVFGASAGESLVSIPLSKVPGFPKDGVPPENVRVLDAQGQSMEAEVFDLDDSGAVTPADELVLEVNVEPCVTETYFLEFGAKAEHTGCTSFVRPIKADSVAIDTGTLKLSKRTQSGTAIESIRLGDLEMGSFEMLIQQSAGGTWWSRPDKLENLLLWEGAICKRLEVTASTTIPADAASGPFAYRATYAFTFFTDREWFAAQFVALKNTDRRPWTFDRYFYYPQSAIGGAMEDDEVGLVGAAGLAAWADEKIGACYGIMAPPSAGVTVVFWKDPSGAEHPDALRKVERLLQPGETYAERAEPVYLFCSLTKDDPHAWMTVKQQIADLPKWEVFGIGD